MKSKTARAAEVTELARKFRLRAAEAEEGSIQEMMLRTAAELEEQAARLSKEPRKKSVRAG